MRLSRRNQLALRRFVKVLLAAGITAALVSLEQGHLDWRTVAMAAGTAALAAAKKWLDYEPARDPERTGRVPIARRPVNTTSTNGAGTVTPPTRPRRPRQPHEPTHT